MEQNENKVIRGKVHSVESFGSVDGPGVRFIIFLQGCHMRCQFCHNPDTWKMESDLEMTADEALQKALRYKSYWKNTGGITVSGGEPLLQMEFVTDLFTKAKAMGINTTLDTAGNPFTREEPFLSRFQKLMEVTDLVMLDIKQIDEDKHKELTGWSNANILDMAQYLSDTGKNMWIRHVLVPERSDFDEYLIRLDAFIKTLKTVRRVEVLPYHTMGKFKWEQMEMDYPLEGIYPPTRERIDNANKLLHTGDYK